MSCDDNPIFIYPRRKISKHKADLKKKQKSEALSESPLTDEQKSGVISQIEKAKEELLVSDVFHSIIASLREGLTLLEEPNLHEIICLGLGKVAWFVRCKYQLAFLLCLRDIYEIEVKVFDPVFIEDDHFILNHFNITVLTENLEGKYKTDKNSTIFFLPHCSQQLSNNIIWANWGGNLRHCILICNSFSSMIENTPKSFWAEYEHIINIYSHVVELAIANTFKYYDIFNDTSIHVFPPSKLKLLPSDFWTNCSVPKYSKDDNDFIRKEK